MRTTLCLLVGLSLLGCGTDDPTSGGPEVLDTLTVPPKPENGLQIITAPFDNIEAGGDYEVCTWTDAIFKQTTDVKSTLAYQTEPPGHHVVLFYTLDKQPPGTQRVCTDTDMASFRYLTGNGNNGAVNSAPGDLVFRIPEGAQLVINQLLHSRGRAARHQPALLERERRSAARSERDQRQLRRRRYDERRIVEHGVRQHGPASRAGRVDAAHALHDR
jgi:hypothetical protein